MTDTREFDAHCAVVGRASPAAERYACGILKRTKRLYAWTYLRWMLDGYEGDEPTPPPDLDRTAAKAVRNRLAEVQQ